MKWNKQGQVIIYGLMLGIVIVILAIAFSQPIDQFVKNARNQTSEFGGMDCSNTSINDYQKEACLATDLSLPIFIGIVLFIGGAVITVKYILQ
jgi:hypothetical protein